MEDKGIIYYTDNVPPEKFLKIIRQRLKKSAGDIPIVWVSQKSIDEDNNIVMPIGRSHKSRTKQILEGLRQTEKKFIFFAEHDVIYHPGHFDFTPSEKKFYYNTNRYWLREADGVATTKNNTTALSQLVAFRDILLEWYEKRVLLYTMDIEVHAGNEPGKHKTAGLLPDYELAIYKSEWPNVDIRHANNYTRSDKFKNNLMDGIPFWGKTKDRYEEFLQEIN